MAMQKLRGVSENSKVITSERSLLSDDSINAIRLTKYAIKVTGSEDAHKMTIAHCLMQARRPAYAVYTKRTKKRRICNRRPRQPRRIKIHRIY